MAIKSAIDFVLMNPNKYKHCRKMLIDKEKDTFDLIDHCLIIIDLNIKEDKRKNKL